MPGQEKRARAFPRQVARIADSIAAFGFNVPVLIDEKGGVLAGHGRVLAARRLGLKEVPTIALDHLSETQARAFMIADNRLGELASWDDARLGLELEELKSLDLDFSIEATGFELKEIDLRIGGAVGRAGDAVQSPSKEGVLPDALWTASDAISDRASRAAISSRARRWRRRATPGRSGPIASFAGKTPTPRPFPRSTPRSGDGRR